MNGFEKITPNEESSSKFDKIRRAILSKEKPEPDFDEINAELMTLKDESPRSTKEVSSSPKTEEGDVFKEMTELMQTKRVKDGAIQNENFHKGRTDD